MSRRIDIVVEDTAWAAFRARALSEGQSLSEWIREAAERRLANDDQGPSRTDEEFDQFFAECDSREIGREPEWDEHLTVIETSRGSGQGDS